MLGYYDSYFGLVPVRVTKVERDGGKWSIYATVTAKRKIGIYGSGFKLVAGCTSIVPRSAVKRTKYNTYILPYDPNEAYKELM